MILTGKEIEKQVKKGRITIVPFLKTSINPNSYNYHIGKTILEVSENIINPNKKTKAKKIVIDEKGFLLKPKKLYLGHTLEKIGSEDYVISLIGRSSIGRLGLFLQITADLGQIGNAHCWTLELTVIQPLWIYPGMKIGQISFWKPLGKKSLKYYGYYSKYSNPQRCKLL